MSKTILFLLTSPDGKIKVWKVFHASATFFHKEKYYMPAMEKHADCDAQADYSKFLAFQSQSSNDGLIWLDFASQIMRSGMKFQV